MSIIISSSLPRSSPAEFRTLSPANVLPARTRRYFLSGSVFLILLSCIEMLLMLLEQCTFDAYRLRVRPCRSLRSMGHGETIGGPGRNRKSQKAGGNQPDPQARPAAFS